MRNAQLGLMAGLAFTLSACGGGPAAPAGGEGNGAAPAAATASAGGMPADWRATDACGIIDKATLGTVLGTTVSETSLGLVHEPNAASGEAATSECSYTLADGSATVMTRWSPINDNTDGVISQTRNATQQALSAFGSSAKVEDIPGVGKASLWVEKIGQLQTFIGEDRMVTITVPAGAGAKDKAIALARKAGA